MRIVGGRHKGRRLIPPRDRRIRPTSDRTREAVFNIMESRFPGRLKDARIADLFAGTGALGIEALSRGGREALFIDKSAAACALLRHNLAALGLSEQATCRRLDATRLMGVETPFDLIFIDPPYGRDLLKRSLEEITTSSWCHPETVIVIESGKTEPITLPPDFTRFFERSYGDSRIAFLTPLDRG